MPVALTEREMRGEEACCIFFSYTFGSVKRLMCVCVCMCGDKRDKETETTMETTIRKTFVSA